MKQAITTLAWSKEYAEVSSKTAAMLYAAGDVYGSSIFEGTISDANGRQFAYGEDNGEFVFMDLDDPENTVYDAEYIKSLNSEWVVISHP